MVGGMTTPLQVLKSGPGLFPDDRFGSFVHWGRYSPIGAGGWVLFRERHSIDGHDKYVTRFEAAARGDGLVPTVGLELS
jgi:hypothetical protein